MGYKVHSINGQMGEVELPVGGSTSWDDVTGKPTEFPPADHTHAATDVASGALAIARIPTGTSATTVALGNHTHAGLTADAAAGTASIRTLGTGATQAAAGNHTHAGLLTGSASAVADATDEPSAVTQLNALLAVLRSRGVIGGA